MCGKFRRSSVIDDLKKLFGIDNSPVFSAQDKIVPTMTTLAVSAQKAAFFPTWGFVPSWAAEKKDAGIINARIETLHEKPSYKTAQRCIIPVNGFFERDEQGNPFDIHMQDDAPFALGAVWDTWKNPTDGIPHDTFALMTTAANQNIARVHDRMPVIISNGDDALAWLSGKMPVMPFAPLILSPLPVARPVKSDPRQISMF